MYISPHFNNCTVALLLHVVWSMIILGMVPGGIRPPEIWNPPPRNFDNRLLVL